MGNWCCSEVEDDSQPIEAKNAQVIEKHLTKQKSVLKKSESRVFKILLLGTGESGKSTLFKQMQILYDGGFNHVVTSNYRVVIQNNLLECIQFLIKAGKRLNTLAEGEYSEEGDYEHWKKESEAIAFIEKIAAVSPEVTDKLRDCIDFLWRNSEGIKKTYEMRNQFYLMDSAE